MCLKMWFILCILGVVSLGGAYGSLADQMSQSIQLCCHQGTSYARGHGVEDCSSSAPPEVPSAFGAICIYAMDQCCKEYFPKKKECEAGIELASNNSCISNKEQEKTCCEECTRGKSAGASRGVSACSAGRRDDVAENMLGAEAFEQCCSKEAASKALARVISEKGSRGSTTSPAPVPLSRMLSGSSAASLCEEYAPNELCAHHCIPVPGSYRCECNPGYKLMADGRNCIEVVKNRCKPRNPCQHKCNDNGVEVKCSCRRGYQLMADGKSCEDIDECSMEPPVCLSSTECHNVQGSYKCIPKKNHGGSTIGLCPPGFSRNIQNNVCDDINECTLPHPPCPGYLCENTVGGYRCGGVSGDPASLPGKRPAGEERCPPGFHTGLNDQCEDVDECAHNKDDCNRLSQFCINTRGSFYCQNKVSKHCLPGFKIDPTTNKCEDINECEDGQDICRPDQICVNVPGEYDCKARTDPRKEFNQCPDGMRMKPGSTVCEDINECVEGTHLCDTHQNCLNTNGSHECHCKLGYEVDPITGGCVDVNECATDTHNCIPGSQRCDNTIGSFLCMRLTSCGTGYILEASTSDCQDIDECALGTHNCMYAGPDFHCENHPGSFRCVRNRVSTTPPPEYEYEYYDSDEEEDNTTKTTAENKNASMPESKPQPVTTTTTTPVKLTPTLPPQETEEVPEREEIPLSRTTDNEHENIQPSSSPETQPQPDHQPTEAQKPETSPGQQPDIWQPEQESDIRLPDLMQDNRQPEPQQPEQQPTTYQQPESRQPDYQQPYPSQTTQSKPEHHKQKTQKVDESYKHSPNYYVTDPQPGSPTDPHQTESDLPPTPPQVVLVDVGKETATIEGEKKDDGSVVVDTREVPKNKWTTINEKPGDSSQCRPGFEMNEFGKCVDVDECVSGRHSCSGLSEWCRNTAGGYVCDCAAGFRRDLRAGDCVPLLSSSIPSSSSPSSSPSSPPSPSPSSSPSSPPSPASSTSSTPEQTLATTPKSKDLFWGYPDYRPLTTRPFRARTLCDVGYQLNSNTGKCEDIDECHNGQANCAAVELCVNTEGGYRCECPPNWRLDDVRHRCVPARSGADFPMGYGNEPPPFPAVSPSEVHQPAAPPSPGSRVVPPDVVSLGDSRSVISCPQGYKLGYDNACEDIDECSSGAARCGGMQCTNLPGGYVCSCPQGHRLVDGQKCEDVDECSIGGSMPVCSQNADCINTVGSYQCKCHAGFRSAPVNDKVCVDVDECIESPAGSLCQHRCNNVWGGYRCSCHRGYRLNPDNSSCADVDECREFKSKLVCVGRCVNEPGSYRCACPQGYRLAEDKRSCIDIDECETGEAPCAGGGTSEGSSDVCLNTRGGYRCHRISCPKGYKLESKHRCTRIEKVCGAADWECAHQPTTYSYNFITFVSKLYIPASKVDLFTMRGPSWPHAHMRFQLRLVRVDAPPSVSDRADIGAFLLVHTGNQAVMSLVRSLEGPQSIELELSMELYNGDQFGGIAVARLYIYVSEFEF